MGWIVCLQLVLVVLNVGGLGVIEILFGEIDVCIVEIEKMLFLIENLFGINLLFLFLCDEWIIDFVVESGVKFVMISVGSLFKLFECFKRYDIIVYYVVLMVGVVVKVVEVGVDGLVVEGVEGGGFKNFEEVLILVFF